MTVIFRGEFMPDTDGSGARLAGTGRVVTALAKLGVDQQKALSFLLGGRSLIETAQCSRISRQTLYRWMKEDVAFRTAYNQWCEQMEQSARSRLVGMTDKATVAVEKALEKGDARTAMQLLKGLGILKERKAGPGNAEEVKKDMEWEKHRRRMTEGKRKRKVADEEILEDMWLTGELLKRYGEGEKGKG
jgi:hypothetical protein